MLKKSLKYLIIAALNLIFLTALLALWTDDLEQIFNVGVRPIEFLKIMGFTLFSLIAMRILVHHSHKRGVRNVKTKISIAALLTFLISFYLYVDYSFQIINNRIVNGRLRDAIASKIKAAGGMANGTKADSLSIREYQEIMTIKKFPKVPNEATNISYLHEYDGFLPDYLFELQYDLPIEIKVDTLHFEQGDFKRSQSVTSVGSKQRVNYTESKQ